MATYKAEFLSRHHRRRLRPREAYSMGLIMLHARLGQHVPRLANRMARLGFVKRLAGVDPSRRPPPFARESFKSWYAGRGPVNVEGEPVVLFPDTFNNYFHPETMKATLEVLEACGRRVIVPQEPLCCGRPLYDYGMLDTARLLWRRMLRALRPYVREGTPVVGVEPSCVAAFRDELVGMLPHDEDAKRLSLQTLTLGEFLVRCGDAWEPPVLQRRAIVHGHCHHKSVMGFDADREVLSRLGLDLEVLDSGCCGLAGSWGFEQGHASLSRQIGERRLLPAVREAPRDALIVADGFSCQHQVEEFTDRRPLHLAQVIRMAMDHGAEGTAGNYPERSYPAA
jgi:Fe-S oxidoreductase